MCTILLSERPRSASPQIRYVRFDFSDRRSRTPGETGGSGFPSHVKPRPRRRYWGQCIVQDRFVKVPHSHGMPTIRREERHDVTFPPPAVSFVVQVLENDAPCAPLDDPSLQVDRPVLASVLSVLRSVLSTPTERETKRYLEDHGHAVVAPRSHQFLEGSEKKKPFHPPALHNSDGIARESQSDSAPTPDRSVAARSPIPASRPLI